MRFNTDNWKQDERPSRDRARSLRQDAAMPERRLWNHLRAKRFVVDGIPALFRRQHPIGPYTADFACLEVGLVVELDGLAHDPSHDARRDEHMTRLGLRVLRFPVGHFMKFETSVLQEIAEQVRRGRAERAQGCDPRPG